MVEVTTPCARCVLKAGPASLDEGLGCVFKRHFVWLPVWLACLSKGLAQTHQRQYEMPLLIS